MRESYHSEPPQFLDRPTTAWEEKLADTFQAIFAEGVYDLEGIAAKLQQSDVALRDGTKWTVERLQAVVKELGW
jgi:hypothetical protein